MKLSEKLKQMTKKQKVAAISAVLVLGCGFVLGGTVYANQAKADEMQSKVDNYQTDLKAIEKEILAFKDTDTNGYLKENVTSKQLEKIQDKIDKIIDYTESIRQEIDKIEITSYAVQLQSCTKALIDVKERIDAQEATNALFQTKDKKALNGTIVNKDLAIIDSLGLDAVNELVKPYEEEKFNDDFENTVVELATIAKAQIEQITKAKEAVAKVYKDNKVVSTDSKLYEAATGEVKKIKNEKAKKELSDQLDKVKAELDKKVAEADKAKAEADAAAQDAVTVAATETQVENAPDVQNNVETGYYGGEDTTLTTPNAGAAYTDNYQAPAAPTTPQAAAPTAPATTPTAPTTPGTGGMTQTELDQSEHEYVDPTQDPNSPWYNK